MSDQFLQHNLFTGDGHQEPIARRSVQLSVMATEQVQSNSSDLTVPLFGTSRAFP